MLLQLPGSVDPTTRAGWAINAITTFPFTTFPIWDPSCSDTYAAGYWGWSRMGWVSTVQLCNHSKVKIKFMFNWNLTRHDSQFSFSLNMKFWPVLILGNWRQTRLKSFWPTLNIKLSLYLLYIQGALPHFPDITTNCKQNYYFHDWECITLSIFHVLQFHQVEYSSGWVWEKLLCVYYESVKVVFLCNQS